MPLTLPSTKDNAASTLDAAISASTLTIPVVPGTGSKYPTIVRGSATSSGTTTMLNATGIGSLTITAGDFIENLTDGSHAWVVSSATNSLTTTPLIGGSVNIWASGNTYAVNRFGVTVGKKNASGVWTSYEQLLIGSHAAGSDTLTVEAGGRAFAGTVANTWSAGDAIELLVTSTLFKGIYGAIAELNTLKADISMVTTLFNARNVKDAVVVATVTAGTLASSFASGQIVDGYTLVTGDRILIKNQAAPAENGIYVVAASGAPVRADDANSGAELIASVVPVQRGNSNADLLFICTTDAPITLGTTAITFTQVGGSAMSKATTPEMQGRVEDTHYATPAKVNDAIDNNVRYVKDTYTVEQGFSVTAGDAVSIDGAGNIVSGTGKVRYATLSPFTVQGTDPNYATQHAALLDATHVVVVFWNATTSRNCVICGVISGGSITWGSPVTLAATTKNACRVVALSSTTFVCSYGGSSTTEYFTAGSVSGTTITLGTEVNKTGMTNLGTGASHHLLFLTSTSFIFIAAISGAFSAVAGSVSGTTITLGAASVTASGSLGNPATNPYYTPYAVALTSTTVVAAQADTSGTTSTFWGITVSGTTLTVSAAQTTTNLGGSVRPILYALDATRFLALTDQTTTTKKVLVGSISGTTITFGTAATTTKDSGNAAAVLSANSFVLLSRDSTTNYWSAQPGTISSTTITLGTDVIIETKAPFSTNHSILGCALSDKNVVFTWTDALNGVWATTVSVVNNVAQVGNREQLASVASSANGGVDPFALLRINDGSCLIGYEQSVVVAACGVTSPIGIATASAAGGSTTNVGYDGVINGLTGIAPGARYFATAAGALTLTPTFYPIGIGTSATTIKVDRSFPNTSAPVAVSATFSPQVIRNDYPGRMALSITAGTISAVQVSRDGSTYYTVAATTNTIVELSPGDFCKVTYSSNPTMNLIPR